MEVGDSVVVTVRVRVRVMGLLMGMVMVVGIVVGMSMDMVILRVWVMARVGVVCIYVIFMAARATESHHMTT